MLEAAIADAPVAWEKKFSVWFEEFSNAQFSSSWKLLFKLKSIIPESLLNCIFEIGSSIFGYLLLLKFWVICLSNLLII